jgi:hypothetical protein
VHVNESVLHFDFLWAPKFFSSPFHKAAFLDRSIST